MSSFKVNYAGIRKPQKKSDQPQNTKEHPAPNQQSSAIKKPKGDFLDLYKVNFNSGNLDYVNLLIKNQTTTTQKVQGPKKKGHTRTKSTFVESAQNKSHPPHSSPNKENKRESVPPPNIVEENDKAPSMRPDDDDGFQEVEIDKTEIVEEKSFARKEEEFYGGNDTHRNLNNTPTEEEARRFEKFFRDDGVVRRSMSLEDLRFEKKVFNKNQNKSTIHHPEEMASELLEKNADESIYRNPKNSRASPKGPKADFVSNLDYYINYFQKSDNVSYRNMKAGQYFRHSGKSHRPLQKELDASNLEVKAMKLQIEKMKWKMEAIITENKMITKELKAANSRDEENQQMLHKMQEQVLHYKQKSHHYKVKCIQLQDVLEQERMDHENNLHALKQVLSNINLALDQKSSPYKNREKQQLHGGFIDKLGFNKKDRERFAKSNIRNHRLINEGVDYPSVYDPRNFNKKYNEKENRDTSKRQSSALLSHKMSVSSTGENVEESFTNQFTNSYDYENTYEGKDSQYNDPFQDTYQHDLAKEQQIKFLQGRLQELMSSGEEVSFSGQTYLKSTTKSSRGNKSHQNKQASTIDIPNYYIARDRHGSIPRQTNNGLSNFEPKEQRSRVTVKKFEETLSPGEASETSFSLHNNSD